VTRRAIFLPFIALLSVAAIFAACGDDDDASPTPSPTPDNGAAKQEIADFITQMASYDGAKVSQADIDFYMAHITDEFVQAFGTEDVAACEAEAEECIGDPLTNPGVDPSTVEINGSEATAIITSDDADFGVRVTKNGDEYLMSGLFVADDEIPGGAEVVQMELRDFAFGIDEADADAVKGGDFALHVTNIGSQQHEVILVELPAEGTIDELLADDSFQPEPIILKFPYSPTDESDVVLPEPLTAGRYAFVCFLPDTSDPEGTPHAFKGMVKEFTVAE
jgi:hypothetical protein